MDTFPQPAAARGRRALVDVGNLMNGRPSLVNHQKQAVAAAATSHKPLNVGNKKPLIPQAAARGLRPLADVTNLMINDRAAPANRQKPLDVVFNRNGKAVKLKECKVKPEVIVTIPDSEKEKKGKFPGQRVCRRVPTLFDNLTKCSRV
jgi:G2/mitotic-specific cyclin-B, other